jgi:hypothetical protein
MARVPLRGAFSTSTTPGTATDLDHDQRLSVVASVNYQPVDWFVNLQGIYGSGLTNGNPYDVPFGTSLFDFNTQQHTAPSQSATIPPDLPWTASMLSRLEKDNTLQAECVPVDLINIQGRRTGAPQSFVTAERVPAAQSSYSKPLQQLIECQKRSCKPVIIL